MFVSVPLYYSETVTIDISESFNIVNADVIDFQDFFLLMMSSIAGDGN